MDDAPLRGHAGTGSSACKHWSDVKESLALGRAQAAVDVYGFIQTPSQDRTFPSSSPMFRRGADGRRFYRLGFNREVRRSVAVECCRKLHVVSRRRDTL